MNFRPALKPAKLPTPRGFKQLTPKSDWSLHSRLGDCLTGWAPHNPTGTISIPCKPGNDKRVPIKALKVKPEDSDLFSCDSGTTVVSSVILCNNRAEVNQQPPMNQLRMRSFMPFWGWTKNTSSSLAQGLFRPPYLPQNFPLLPTSAPPPTSLTSFPNHSISKAQSSVELPSLSSTKLRNTRLEEGGKLNVEGKWGAQHWRKVESSTQEERFILHPFIPNAKTKEER